MTPSNDRKFNLLSNGSIESFWDTLWLELWPFLCSIVESRRIRVPMHSSEARRNFLLCCVRRAGGIFFVSVHVWEWVTCGRADGGRRFPRARSHVTHSGPTLPHHHHPPVAANHAKCTPQFRQIFLIIGPVWTSCVTLLQKRLPHHRNFYKRAMKE